MSVFARARRIVAVAACGAAALAAAGSAGAQATPRESDRIAQMSAAQAREFALGEIRALAALSRAGSNHEDVQCRTAALRARNLAAAAIEAVVQADMARDRALRAVGTQPTDDPAIQSNYQRVAEATAEARAKATQGVAACPDLVARR